MVVGAHRDVLIVHTVGNAVIEDVADDVQVVAADGFGDQRLGLAAAEARAVRVDQVAVEQIAVGEGLGAGRHFAPPAVDVIVYRCRKLLAAPHADDPERAYRHRIQIVVTVSHKTYPPFFSHDKNFVLRGCIPYTGYHENRFFSRVGTRF